MLLVAVGWQSVLEADFDDSDVYKHMHHDQVRRIRNVEEKFLGANSRIDRVVKKTEDIDTVLQELSEHVMGRNGDETVERITSMEGLITDWDERSDVFQRELRRLDDSTAMEIGGLRQLVANLGKDVQDLKERPVVVASSTPEVNRDKEPADSRTDDMEDALPQQSYATQAPERQAHAEPEPKTLITKRKVLSSCADCRKRHRKCKHDENTSTQASSVTSSSKPCDACRKRHRKCIHNKSASLRASSDVSTDVVGKVPAVKKSKPRKGANRNQRPTVATETPAIIGSVEDATVISEKQVAATPTAAQTQTQSQPPVDRSVAQLQLVDNTLCAAKSSVSSNMTVLSML